MASYSNTEYISWDLTHLSQSTFQTFQYRITISCHTRSPKSRPRSEIHFFSRDFFQVCWEVMSYGRVKLQKFLSDALFCKKKQIQENTMIRQYISSLIGIYMLTITLWESLHVYSVSLIYIMAAQPVLAILEIASAFQTLLFFSFAIGASLFHLLIFYICSSQHLYMRILLPGPQVYLYAQSDTFPFLQNPNSPIHSVGLRK